MGLREQKAEYAEQYRYSGYVKEGELNRYLDAGLEFFEARGIELPSEGDFSLWKEQLLTTLKPNTVRNYIREFKKFTVWCRQKGDRSMGTTTEATQPVEFVEVEQPEDTPETTHSEGSLEVEPVQGVRRGRKPKPDHQVRVQVSAYLDKETYEGIKIASSSTGLTVSDILAKAAFFFVRDNAEEIESYRQFTKGQHWKFCNGR